MVQKLWSTIRENKREEKNIYLLFVFLVFTVFEVSLISRLIQIFSDVEIRFNLLQHKKQSFCSRYRSLSSNESTETGNYLSSAIETNGPCVWCLIIFLAPQLVVAMQSYDTFFIGENDHRKSLKPFYDPMIRATDTPSHLFHIQSFVNLPIFLDRCR